jgi:hypothetical protein
MASLFHTITDFAAGSAEIARRPYGVIEMADGELFAVRLRPWPKLFSSPGRASARGDRCWLYYNQPRSCPNFLALKYVVSSRDCTLATFRGSLVVLDEIARLKRSWAIVCHVANLRISDRLLARWGWERHLQSSRRRHYIKRFYGEKEAAASQLIASASFARQHLQAAQPIHAQARPT